MTSDRRLRAPWWLLLGLAIAIVLEAITVFGTQSSAESDAALKIPFSPTLQIAAAGGWAIALSYLLVDLMRHRRWAFRRAGMILTLYGLWKVGWEVAFARSDYDRGRIAFSILATLLVLLPVWWATLRRRWLTA